MDARGFASTLLSSGQPTLIAGYRFRSLLKPLENGIGSLEITDSIEPIRDKASIALSLWR